MIWLDGRHARQKTGEHVLAGHFTLRTASINSDGSVHGERVVDTNTCTCCPTAVGVGAAGPVAAWRSRRDGEIRDHHTARLRSPSTPKLRPLGNEGWHFPGCPTNGPALALRGQQAYAGWYTAEGNRPRLRAAVSHDGGARFGTPFALDDALPYGRTDLAIAGRDALALWIAAPADDAADNAAATPATADSAVPPAGRLTLARLGADGCVGTSRVVAAIDTGRDSGMPQLGIDGTSVLVVWTANGPAYGLKSARLPLARIAPARCTAS